MSESWMKVEKNTPEKPEVFALASLLSIDPEQAFAKCFKFWRWADSHIADGNAFGVTKSAVDALVGRDGFAEAMVNVGWLEFDGKLMRVPEFDRHMSQSAKTRGLTQKRVAAHRGKCNADSNGTSVTDALPDERRREENNQPSKDVGIVGTKNSLSPTIPPFRPSKELRDEIRNRHTANLEHLDWDQAIAFAEIAARKIPPLDQRDRRAWIKFGVLAATACSESWLADTADAVSRMPTVKKTRQACFVAALKAKASETWGIDEPTFTAMVRSIEIPSDVWKSKILEVRK